MQCNINTFFCSALMRSGTPDASRQIRHAMSTRGTMFAHLRYKVQCTNAVRFAHDVIRLRYPDDCHLIRKALCTQARMVSFLFAKMRRKHLLRFACVARRPTYNKIIADHKHYYLNLYKTQSLWFAYACPSICINCVATRVAFSTPQWEHMLFIFIGNLCNMKELWTLAVYTYVCVLFTFVGTTHESNIRMFVCTYQPQ